MSQSAGPGSPLMFRCSRCRRNCTRWDPDLRYYHVFCRHKTTLTGKWRKRERCVGVRTSLVDVQYACECMHTGWSNHNDIAERAVREGHIPADVRLG